MNLRIRDHAIYWFHRALAAMGSIRADSLEEIRSKGFRRVLVVATTAIGDALLCTPLIQSLRAARPDLHLGFWVHTSAMPLFEHWTALNQVIPYHGKYRRITSIRAALREGNYDLALVANANDPDIIPLIWWSGCRHIIRRPQRFTIYSFMIANPDMLSRMHHSGHAIERNLQFCDLLHIPRQPARTVLEIPHPVETSVRARLEGKSAPWWAIHPGASKSKKQWGIDRYTTLARELLTRHPGTLVLTGSPAERDTCCQIEMAIGRGPRVCNLAGELNLNEFAALLKQLQLFVSGDTGPYHMAMAVGTPTVTLFAPWDPGSSPEINGPSFDLDKHPIIQTARMGDPISSIPVEQVLGACSPFLNSKPSEFHFA